MGSDKGLHIMEISVVTTFNKRGLDQYGRRMIKSFCKQWPNNVKLYVYAEDCKDEVPVPNDNVIVLDLHEESPEIVAFKNKWKDVPKANGDVSKDPVRSRRKDAGKGFKWDAIRFSHKVYSIFACAKRCNTEVLMWMDADTYCHSPITFEKLQSLVPLDKDLCYVGRANKWPECGLYSINLTSKGGKKFLNRFQQVYDEAENGIFQMAEWHDSFVFEVVRKQLQPNCWNWSEGIITGEGHPLINSVWGSYLDHLKGGRKELGKSKPTDLIKKRNEAYWSTQ